MTTTTVVAPGKTLSPEQHLVIFRNAPLPKLPTPSELFDAQMAHFVNLGIGTESDYERLRAFIPDSLDFVLRPAQPNPLDFNARMAQMVKLGDKNGRSYIAFADTTDEIPVPTAAHLMVGVDDGENRLKTRPSVSQTNIVTEGRSPWNPWDGICYASLFPFALQGRGLDLVAGRCGSVNWPDLYLVGDEPSLVADGDGAGDEWGAPSCRERRGL